MKKHHKTDLAQWAIMAGLVLLFSLALVACGGDDDDGLPLPPLLPDPGGNDDTSPGKDGFSVSGRISIPGYIQSDGDVNDPNSPVRLNSKFSEAQPLFNPVSVGGYLDQGKDVSDIYRVNLLEGQTISLIIPHHERGDFDLYTYPADCTDATCTSNRCQRNGDVVGSNGASFLNAGANEKITVKSKGDYFIEVCAWEGEGNYSLMIGGKPAVGAFSAEDDFVPNQIIARFDRQSGAAVQAMAATGLRVARGHPDRAMLVELDPENVQQPILVGEERKSAVAGTTEASSPPRSKRTAAAAKGEEYLAKWDTLNAIARLSRQPGVSRAEPNYILRAMQVPNDKLYGFQWHYPLINLPEAWDITIGSNEVIVAVVDSGIKAGHPDIQGQLVDGYDFVANAIVSGDGDGIDNNPDDPGSSTPGQSSHHGTHVAGTIAASSNNGRGAAGTAWQARVMPLRVMNGEGKGDTYDILQGIRYAAGLPNDSRTVPPKKADIINLSLGGPNFSAEAQELFAELYNNGVIVVAAAGNGNSSQPDYPASYEHVISVSAVDMEKKRAPYSSYGAYIDIAAPGGDSSVDKNGDGYNDGVLSLGYDKEKGEYLYSFLNGTSMAAPHVAGVIALMKAVNPGLTPADFDALLAAGELTEDLGDAGRDDIFGHGLVNALKAVNAAANPGTAPPQTGISVTPRMLNFGLAETTLTLTVSSVSGSAVTSIGVDQGYITVAPETVDDNGLGTYRISVDRDGLPDGAHSAVITIQSAQGDVTVPLLLQVSSAPGGGLVAEAGYLYVILFDADTMEGKYQLELKPDGNSVYDFSFSNVSPGEYLLIAGSDFDNNGSICDYSESCGIYPRRNSNNLVIKIDGDKSNLDFLVDYEIGLRPNALSSGERKPEATGQLPFATRRVPQ